MQDDPDGHAVGVGQIAYEIEDLHLIAQVQVGGRLVEQQDVGVLGETAGEPDPLQLAAGEALDAPVREVGEVGDGERAVDRPGTVGVRAAQPPTVGGRPNPTTSRTLSPAGAVRLWASRVMRRAKSLRDRARASTGSEPSGAETVTVPVRALWSRATARSRVDFPLPFGPMRAVTRPRSSRRSAPWTTSARSYATVRPRASRPLGPGMPEGPTGLLSGAAAASGAVGRSGGLSSRSWAGAMTLLRVA